MLGLYFCKGRANSHQVMSRWAVRTRWCSCTDSAAPAWCDCKGKAVVTNVLGLAGQLSQLCRSSTAEHLGTGWCSNRPPKDIHSSSAVLLCSTQWTCRLSTSGRAVCQPVDVPSVNRQAA